MTRFGFHIGASVTCEDGKCGRLHKVVVDPETQEVSDPSALLSQAREAAWNDARDKAAQLAALADGELEEVLTINESSRAPRPVGREAAMDTGARAVPIEPGTQTLEVSVQVTWRLQ